MTSGRHPELGSGDTYLPDEMRVVHFGSAEPYGEPGEEPEPEPEEHPGRKKERNLNSRQYRQRKTSWWRKR